ncbi:MAG: glucokinase [Candidatus Zixiibacteriota bacterium]
MLAGYISGTTVELAKVRQVDSGMKLTSQTTYASHDFTNFESILNLYLKRQKTDLKCACFGVAGPVINDEVLTTRLSWRLVAADIAKQFGIGKVQLLNDIVAIAHSLPVLGKDRFYTINAGEKVPGGNIGLIAAGSGLGESLVFVDGQSYLPVASEGGHSDFAPSSQLESELWAYIYSDHGHVAVEDVLSLKGLDTIYNFVIDSQGNGLASWYQKAKDKPSAIIEKALSGSDAYATRTMEIFIDCYASEASNLALKGMTLGGIFIGGMIGPQIITLLDGSKFMERFVKRGKMEALLAKMPVEVIIEEKAALIGAAAVTAKMNG